MKNREKILEWMNKKDIRDFKQVASYTSKYVDDPVKMMEIVTEDLKNEK